jgi:hypothetical protein
LFRGLSLEIVLRSPEVITMAEAEYPVTGAWLASIPGQLGRGKGAAFRIHAPGEKAEMLLLLKGVEAAAHLRDEIGAMLPGGIRDLLPG